MTTEEYVLSLLDDLLELVKQDAAPAAQNQWYYTRTHPAPEGVTPEQGPRGAWRWNPQMARAAGLSDDDIDSHLKTEVIEVEEDSEEGEEEFDEALQEGEIGSSALRDAIDNDETAKNAIDTLAGEGKPYIVGGSVRDALLGKPSKDVDIEVYGIPEDELSNIVETKLGGKKEQIGKSFGVFKVGDIDIALPRTETATGTKHTDFDIKTDPNLPLEQAAKRRDFTFNALMYNYQDDEILDFFGGQEDIENKNIKHVDDATFVEDPLRVYRAAQFAARFDFSIDPSTQKLAKSMDLSTLPKERIFGEFEKMFLKSDTPSKGIQALDDMGVLDKHFSEIADLKGTHQREDYHAEGDVFTHTKMTLDEAAEIIKRFPDEKDKTIIMLATLCHDLGKPATATPDGRAIGHEAAGVEVAESLLNKLTDDKEIINTVLPIVENHLRPPQYYRNKAGDAAFRRLINKHGLKFIELLSAVSEADVRGRLNKAPDGTITKPENKENEWFRQRVKEVSEKSGTKEGKIAPLVTGDDLKELGFTQGKQLGDVLRDVQRRQEEGNLSSTEEALSYIREKLSDNSFTKQKNSKIQKMNITDFIHAIDTYIEKQELSALLHSDSPFAKFLLLKDEKWYYVRNHPAPEGVTPQQGPQGGWRWNAAMARGAGLTEGQIAEHIGSSENANAKATSDVGITAQADIAEEEPDITTSELNLDDFVSWEEWSQGFKEISSDELKLLTRQQSIIGMGDGTASKTKYPFSFAVKNDEGKITQVTSADGQLVAVTETSGDKGPTRTNVKFSTIASSHVQFTYERTNVDKGELEIVRNYSFAHKASSAGAKFLTNQEFAKNIGTLRNAVKRDLTSKKRVIREAAVAVALLDATFKRVDADEGRSNVTSDRPDKKKIAKLLKTFKEKGGTKNGTGRWSWTQDSKGRIFRTMSGEKRDVTPYEIDRVTTYGISSIQPKHVTQLKDGRVQLKFLGKDAVENKIIIKDSFLAKELLARKKNPPGKGTETTSSGKKKAVPQLLNIGYSSISNYMKTNTGVKDASPHHFRYFHATRLAEEAMGKIGAPKKLTMDGKVRTQGGADRTVRTEMNKLNNEMIALRGTGLTADEKLGATAMVCKNLHTDNLIATVGEYVAPNLSHKPKQSIETYIDPTVFETTGWSESMGENTYELTNAVMKMRFTTKKAKKTTKKKKSTKRKK